MFLKRRDHPKVLTAQSGTSTKLWVSWTDWQLSGLGVPRDSAWPLQVVDIEDQGQVVGRLVGLQQRRGWGGKGRHSWIWNNGAGFHGRPWKWDAGCEMIGAYQLEDPGSEMKGLWCHSRISGSLTHQTLPPAWCPPLHIKNMVGTALQKARQAKPSPHNSIKIEKTTAEGPRIRQRRLPGKECLSWSGRVHRSSLGEEAAKGQH